MDAAPEGTACLLLAVEDLDVPAPRPIVHCLAVLDPARLAGGHDLPTEALARAARPDGVALLRSTFGRGYMRPEPIKGHGPHRYVFQLFALGAPLDVGALERLRPRAVMASVRAPVLGRGRLTGIYER